MQTIEILLFLHRENHVKWNMKNHIDGLSVPDGDLIMLLGVTIFMWKMRKYPNPYLIMVLMKYPKALQTKL